MRITEIIKELKNYYFIKRTIRKHKDTVEWKKHNLSVGYFGVIYTVINLPPEVFESEEQYYSVYIMEMMMPINNYLESLNLQEVITARVDNIVDKERGIFAYGVKYIPLFRQFTGWYVLSRLAVINILVWLQLRYEVFTTGIPHVLAQIKGLF